MIYVVGVIMGLIAFELENKNEGFRIAARCVLYSFIGFSGFTAIETHWHVHEILILLGQELEE